MKHYKYLRVHSGKAYEGQLNLLKSEKSLIRKAWIKNEGSVIEMARDLEVSVRVVLIKIIEHNLSNEFYKK